MTGEGWVSSSEPWRTYCASRGFCARCGKPTGRIAELPEVSFCSCATCAECPEPECCDVGWPCAVVQDIDRELTGRRMTTCAGLWTAVGT